MKDKKADSQADVHLILPEIPKSIQSEIDILHTHISTLMKWSPNAAKLEALLELFTEPEDTPAEDKRFGRCYVTIGVQSGSLHGCLLFLNVKKDIRDVLPLLRCARKEYGWKVQRVDEYQEIGRRSYFIPTDEGPVWICAMLPTSEMDGAVCRYVEVGKKTVPILELQCEDKHGKMVAVSGEVGVESNSPEK